MPVLTLAEFRGEAVRGRLFGLDVGEKTIGIAMSDQLQMIATPLETLERRKFSQDFAALLALVNQHHIAGLVIGLPLNMDGSEGPRCQSVRQFATNLLTRANWFILFWDERLSTVAVTNMMLEADLSRRRRADLVDKLAAGYILQGALDRLAVLRKSEKDS